MIFDKSNSLSSLAEGLIPEQTMTMAKKASNFPQNYPKYIKSAIGCELFDVDGNKYIDYSMSLGVYTLGYNYKGVVDAVHDQQKEGSLFSLPHSIEIDLAEKLNQIIPCAEKVRFFKNGADATGIAIRLARSFTDKTHIIQCGYHGHHDWYSHVLRDSGTVDEVKNYTHSVNYNDFDSIEKILHETKNNVAAIIIETAFESPKEDYLKKIKSLCDDKNIVLIFDEMWTGFRFAIGGAQDFFNIVPDIATFSKGISNGFPISVVAGKSKIMDFFEKIWGFTTFGGDALPMAAALFTIQEIKDKNVISYIWNFGNSLKEALEKSLIKYGLDKNLDLIGYDCRFMFVQNSFFNEKRMKMLELLASRGILWNNMFVPSYSHQKSHLDKTVDAFDYTFKNISK